MPLLRPSEVAARSAARGRWQSQDHHRFPAPSLAKNPPHSTTPPPKILSTTLNFPYAFHENPHVRAPRCLVSWLPTAFAQDSD